MNLLKNMKIGSRLGLAFGAIIALACAVVLIGIARLSALTDSIVLIGGDRVTQVQKLADITDDVNLIVRELSNTMIIDDPAAVAAALETVKTTRASIGKTLDEVTAMITSDEGRKRLAAVTATRAAYLPVQIKFTELIAAGNKAEAKALLSNALRPTQLAFISAIDQLKDLQIRLIRDAAADGEALYGSSRLLMLGLLLGMAVIGTLCGWFITRSITGPLRQAVAVAEKVAAGDTARASTPVRATKPGSC